MLVEHGSPKNLSGKPVAIIIHHPDTSIPISDVVHHTLQPDETLFFFRGGYHHKLNHRDRDKSYHPDEIADLDLLLAVTDVMFRFGPNSQPEFVAAPKPETKVSTPAPGHTVVIRGTRRYDVFAGIDFRSAMTFLESYEQKSSTHN